MLELVILSIGFDTKPDFHREISVKFFWSFEYIVTQS